MSKEVLEKCARCHGKLTYKISETVIHGYPDRQLVVKNVPGLECQKCGLMMQAEPDQNEKTDAFIISIWHRTRTFRYIISYFEI